MFKRFSVFAASLGAVALLGAALAGSAFAQGPADPAAPAQPGVGMGGRWGASQVAGTTQRGPAWGGQATLDAASKLIGQSVDDIRAARLDGKSLAQIAEAAGKTKDQLVNTILDAKKAIIDGLVKAGTLTQDQATLMLDNMKERVSTSVDRTETGPGNGRGNGGNGPCLTDGTVTPGAAAQNGVSRMGRAGGMGGFGMRFQAQPAQ